MFLLNLFKLCGQYLGSNKSIIKSSKTFDSIVANHSLTQISKCRRRLKHFILYFYSINIVNCYITIVQKRGISLEQKRSTY